MKYTLSLIDREDSKRINKIINHHVGIMEAMNEDSKESSKGGAAMSYEVEIEFKDRWD